MWMVDGWIDRQVERLVSCGRGFVGELIKEATSEK